MSGYPGISQDKWGWGKGWETSPRGAMKKQIDGINHLIELFHLHEREVSTLCSYDKQYNLL